MLNNRERTGILNLSKVELVEALNALGVPKYRAAQLHSWLFKFGKTSFAEMTNTGASLQQALDENFYIYRPQIANVLKSSDGTIKFLLRLADANTIETVFIPTEKRNTICVSSQVGCAVGCRFCNTGYNGFIRNLTTEEIIGQYMIVRDYLHMWNTDERLTNIVFMGMGEPLYNVHNVLKTIDLLVENDFDNLSRRKITLSTSGIAPVLSEIVAGLKCRLAISLHAPSDSIRSRIMPINELYNIEKLMACCQKYCEHHASLKITFEYLLLKDINDMISCANQLIALLKPLNAKVNLIQFNAWPGSSFAPSSYKNVVRFAKTLEKAGIEAPVRERRGSDIMAACGQLQSQSIVSF